MDEQTSRYAISAARLEEGALIVDWADGHRSRFHAIWIRHQCACEDCGTPITAVRGLRLHHIPEDIAAVSLTRSGDRLTLAWSHQDHRSSFAARWLRDHCYSAEERARRKHKPRLWDSALQAAAPFASLAEAEAEPRARLKMLETLRDYGFVKVTDVPTELGQADRLIEIVGRQRQTHYGTYRLSKKRSVDNVGDITAALDPHIDETYRLSTIGITVFQVLRPSAEGGASTLVDGFEVVRRLRERHPEDFELLKRLPVISQRYDAARNSGGEARWYVSRMPVIKLDQDGDVSGIRLNERQISPLDIDADLVEPCYRALRRVFEIAYDPALRLTFALEAGEGLLFDNQRVLHGRTAFSPEEPARAVLTSSVDLEEFHSSLRLLQWSLDPERLPMMLCQGMAV